MKDCMDHLCCQVNDFVHFGELVLFHHNPFGFSDIVLQAIIVAACEKAVLLYKYGHMKLNVLLPVSNFCVLDMQL